MKKKILVLMFMTTMLFTTTEKIYAKEMSCCLPENEVVFSTAYEGPVVFAEEKGYLFRVCNGVLQRRLWSYTYAKWLDSDWINC